MYQPEYAEHRQRTGRRTGLRWLNPNPNSFEWEQTMDARGTFGKMVDAWKNRDWDALRDVIDSDYVYTGPDATRAVGVDAGLAAGWIGVADAFPDGDLEVNGAYVDGDTVVTEFRFTGTNTGNFFEMAPTGKRVDFEVCNVMHLRGGKVVAERDYADVHGFLEQLGVV